jgi:hypothetical protein
VPFGPLGESLVMILATSGINGNSHGCGSPQVLIHGSRVPQKPLPLEDPGLGSHTLSQKH